MHTLSKLPHHHQAKQDRLRDKSFYNLWLHQIAASRLKVFFFLLNKRAAAFFGGAQNIEPVFLEWQLSFTGRKRLDLSTREEM